MNPKRPSSLLAAALAARRAAEYEASLLRLERDVLRADRDFWKRRAEALAIEADKLSRQLVAPNVVICPQWVC